MSNNKTIMKRLEKVCTEQFIPLYAIFELTYKCNLRCRHCYAPKDCNDELSFGEIESILDQLVEIGTFNLIFTGGEILERKDFFDTAKAAKSRGFFMTFMTNGTLIAPEYADEIAKLKPIGVEISLYGACADTHDYVTKKPGSFIHTIDAIKLLRERNIVVLTKTVLMRSNFNERKEIEALSKDLDAIPKINVGIIPTKDGSLIPLKHDLSVEDLEIYFASENRLPDSSTPDTERKQRITCKAGKAVCCISPDGEVSPCLLMPAKLGNLRQQTMKEIWHQEHNDFLNKIRSLTAYKSSPCLSCDLLKFCNRCPGLAYSETGDPFGCSPSACQYAKRRALKSSEGTAKNFEEIVF